jgi:hypothetical protein
MSAPSSGLKLTVEGLDLRGNGDFLHYADLSPLPSDTGPSSFIEQDIKKVIPKYHVGYKFGLGYQFPYTNTDIEVRWLYYDSKDTNSITNPSSATFLEVPFILGSGLGFNVARGSVEYRYSAVDLDLGRSITFFNCFQTRFYAGLRYAQIDRKFEISQENPVFDEQPVRFINIVTDLNVKGAGPQVGINSIYYFVPSFGLESDISISGITETSKSNKKARVLIGPTDFEIINVINPDDQDRIIPGVDASVGFQYHHQFCNGTTIKASAGYQFIDYIGAFSEIIIATGVNGGISSIDFRKIDATFEGPYLRLSVKI